ncbi:hypothetical protein Y032_0360g3442 [Ancylostoma ceylanicum]|uniref:Uncharacterized protein n=1 Tax=Ancylostoma ceylanicum TaxID=53326 RepID=A0A016RWD9_9BILA|nr:hypothetical protein Y032_0360g3442 [Ancylostoma ceylanicum]
MTSHPGFSSSSERSLSLLAVFRNISQSQHLWRTRIRSSSDQHNRCKRKRSDPIANSQPCSSSTPTFKRESFARQYEFNTSIIRKLVPLQEYQGIGVIVSDVIQDLNSRNETLKIADAAENYGQNLREDISSIRLYQTMLKNSRILSMDEEVEQMFQCYW